MRSRRSVMAPARGLPPLEQMPAARRLGAQIALVVPVRREDMGHPLRDGDAAPGERGHLLRLLTHNPEEVAALNRGGIAVAERVPHIFPAHRHNEGYLRTKATRSGLPRLRQPPPRR